MPLASQLRWIFGTVWHQSVLGWASNARSHRAQLDDGEGGPSHRSRRATGTASRGARGTRQSGHNRVLPLSPKGLARTLGAEGATGSRWTGTAGVRQQSCPSRTMPSGGVARAPSHKARATLVRRAKAETKPEAMPASRSARRGLGLPARWDARGAALMGTRQGVQTQRACGFPSRKRLACAGLGVLSSHTPPGGHGGAWRGCRRGCYTSYVLIREITHDPARRPRNSPTE